MKGAETLGGEYNSNNNVETCSGIAQCQRSALTELKLIQVLT